MKIITGMKPKRSTGYDGVSNKLLKQISQQIIKPLTHLINLSIDTNYVPPEWKTARIIPLYKSGPKDDCSNYRPISLLPTISKVVEKVINY